MKSIEDNIECYEELKDALIKSNLFVKERHGNKVFLDKFLAQCNYSVENAFMMIQECEKWRSENEIDKMVDYELPKKQEVMKIYPQYYHLHDKSFRPVHFEHLGKLDIKEILKVTDADSLYKNQIADFEKLMKIKFPACSLISKTIVHDTISVMDLKGVSLVKFPKIMSFIRGNVSLVEKYYPGISERLFIINAPVMFKGIWSVVKKWIKPVSADKVTILGSKYMEALLEYIEIENIPKGLGGNCTCDDCVADENGPWKN